MSFFIASLIAFAVASATTAMLLGRPTRRPDPGTVAASAPEQRRRFAIPKVQRTPRVVGPAALAAWADDLARALRHGSTLHAALTDTLPNDPIVELHSRSLRHWLGRGATVADACDEWFDELSEDARVRGSRRRRRSNRTGLIASMAAVIAATASLGGAAAAPLDRFAVTMRQRASDDLERAAHSAQAKMSAKVLTSVPLVVLALLLLTDADVRAVVASTNGGVAVAVGLGLNTLGALWMRRIAGNNGQGAPC